MDKELFIYLEAPLHDSQAVHQTRRSGDELKVSHHLRPGENWGKKIKFLDLDTRAIKKDVEKSLKSMFNWNLRKNKLYFLNFKLIIYYSPVQEGLEKL